MRVVLDVTSVPNAQDTIETICACLQAHNDCLIITCVATDAEQVLSLRTWINEWSNQTGHQSGDQPALSVIDQLRVWQPSGTNAPEVDACLFAGFATSLMPDLIISDLLAQQQHAAGSADVDHAITTVRVISLADLAVPNSASDRQALRAQLNTLADSIKKSVPGHKPQRLSLALLSPLPPARSGVADCSAELFWGLREHYNVTLIDTTPEDFRHWDAGSREQTQGLENIKSLRWFLENASHFDRVVYQLGNSDYHAGIWPAMAQVPGVAALHDLYQGDYLASEQTRDHPQMWPEILLYEHGYQALARAQANHHDAVLHYAGNYRVFRDSLGVVLHSQYAAQLATDMVGRDVSRRIQVIPLVRQPASTPTPVQRQQARHALGLPSNGTIVCSFGYIGASKLPLHILDAWRDSELAQDPDARLIFVGRNHPGRIGQQVTDAIAALPNADRVHITGFVDTESFEHYLRAADFAVQLRGFSRGETSGAVLHAMGHGLPQIVNANGSFAELDREAVWMLPDEFATADLVHAMNTLHRDVDKRQAMAERGPLVIQTRHSPAVCASAYRDFIETCYGQRTLSHPRKLLTTIKQAWPEGEISAVQRASLANAIDFNRAAQLPRPRLLLDLTCTYNTEMQTGIQRVALALFDALLELEPAGLVVTPVYLDNSMGQWHYYQANDFMTKRLGLKEHWLTDHHIMPRSGDVLLTLDLSTWQLGQAHEQGLFRQFRACGVRCHSIVYDLLPVTLPETFPPNAKKSHEDWLSAVCRLDGAICISKHVASELAHWRDQQADIKGPYRIGNFMLGADTETFKPEQDSTTPPGYSTPTTSEVTNPPVFLMVGTIEPRKGYLETIHAFLELWASGFDARLIIVGREGWTNLSRDKRKNIPETVDLLRNHPERFRRLLWLDNADDAALERSYARADCLIAASYDEGFGLPIIEATRHGVPVLARDIAVFREVAPAGTTFFKDGELTQAIRNWTKPAHPPKDEHTITWRESAQQVLQWLKEEST